MKFLFDYKGNHIANVVNGELNATTGKNIGHLNIQFVLFLSLFVFQLDGVNYRIEQSKGFCLITAWLGDENPEIPDTSFF